MKVALFGKRFDDDFASHVQKLIHSLLQRGVNLVVDGRFHQFLHSQINGLPEIPDFDSFNEVKDVDFIISIGGDGTLLETATLVREREIPVLGINTGRLGFLSLVDVDMIEQAVDALHSGRYAIDKRTLLQVTSEGSEFNGFPFALNELTVINSRRNSMIAVHTYVNDEYMNTYWADGLVVATPTGSTAYSLSCGGPIVMPDSGNFLITPIAPHNLNVRPFVLPDRYRITLRPEGRDNSFQVNLDSRPFTLDGGHQLEITLAPFGFNLINLHGQTFFTTIRNKLGWGLDKRN